MAGEGDLVADLRLGVVDPGVGHVGVNIGGHVVVDRGAVLDRLESAGDIGLEHDRQGGERDVLAVSQVGVGLRVALPVGDGWGVGVGYRERCPYGLRLWRRQAERLQHGIDRLGGRLVVGARPAVQRPQCVDQLGAVLVAEFGQRPLAVSMAARVSSLTSQRRRRGRSTVMRMNPNDSFGRIFTRSPSVKSP